MVDCKSAPHIIDSPKTLPLHAECEAVLSFKGRLLCSFTPHNYGLILFLGLLAALFIILLPTVLLYATEVANIKPSQIGNRILFEFDVKGEPNEETDVNITLTIKGETYTSDKLHLEGDFGKTKTGKGKRIYWNVLQDFPKGLNEPFDYDVSAIGIEMVYVKVKGGCFNMGDIFGDGELDETPVHEVCVDDFYIGKYEVTQGQWKAIMGKNPSYFKYCGDNCPVENVSWNESQDFINKLNKKTGKNYKLPTEAEWEYAARSGGKHEEWAGTSNESELGDYAWYEKNSGRITHPVGQKKPNGLGLYDMSGNVWEWVNDWYDENYYKNSHKKNPKGLNNSSGLGRGLRGGGWNGFTWMTRTTGRGRFEPSFRNYSFGLRLVMTK